MNNNKAKVLIVEDDTRLNESLELKMKKEGYEVLTAFDGDEGLSRAIHEHPDIILLDIVMPVMDGITMLNRLRLDEWGANVKVIFLTNLADDDKQEEARKKGAMDFLVKTDWSLEDVAAKVKQRLAE